MSLVRFRPEAPTKQSPGRAPPSRQHASVAHLVERHLAKVEVASSSLVTRSNFLERFRSRWCHSQVVRQSSAKAPLPSSNLGGTSILTKRYRCVWRKARRINRFRAFSGPDFFFQTIDANRCFRASAPIRTGRFPVSCRCVQPVPFFSGDFSGWQRYFSQKRITKTWASFCWS